MLNISHALDRMNIRSFSRCAAAQDVRKMIQEDGTDVSKLIETLIDVKFNDFVSQDHAIMTVQYIVDEAVKHNGDVEDADIVLQGALRKAEALMNRPDMQWMHARSRIEERDEPQEQVSEMIDTKVAVKADGSIKKGGRQVLAAELYKKFVVEAEVKPTNAWFKELLVKELGMTSAGASTYAYNMDAEHKMLVKATKGKKAE